MIIQHFLKGICGMDEAGATKALHEYGIASRWWKREGTATSAQCLCSCGTPIHSDISTTTTNLDLARRSSRQPRAARPETLAALVISSKPRSGMRRTSRPTGFASRLGYLFDTRS